MTSLSDVYEGGINTVADPHQRRVGVALFAAGVAMVVASISIATTGLASYLGLDVYAARELAGVLAGLGIPAVFVGMFVVMPAQNTARAAAAIGASLAGFGVLLFTYAYPDRWLAADPPVALATTAIYSLGTLITFWCLFISIATFNRRNDPGGTARVEMTEEGNIRVIRTTEVGHGGGSVGLFGRDPDGSVPTQTNEEAVTQSQSASKSRQTHPGSDYSQSQPQSTTNSHQQTPGQPTPTSDGAGAVTDDALVDDDILEATKERGKPDRYCGNCSQFEYVRADGNIAPYCGLREELMDDMDACDDWDENS